MIGGVDRFETFERNRAVDHLLSGTAASLWFDPATGRLSILASKADADELIGRRRGGGGLEFVCLVADLPIVDAISTLNHRGATQGIPGRPRCNSGAARGLPGDPTERRR